jgi:hypothetical protein
MSRDQGSNSPPGPRTRRVRGTLKGSHDLSLLGFIQTTSVVLLVVSICPERPYFAFSFGQYLPFVHQHALFVEH